MILGEEVVCSKGGVRAGALNRSLRGKRCGILSPRIRDAASKVGLAGRVMDLEEP